MAYDFSPWLDQIRRDPYSAVNGSGTYARDGMYAQPIYGAGQQSGMDGYEAGPLTGYRVYKNLGGESAAQYNGTPYEVYDPSGKLTGTGQWSGLSDSSFMDYAPFLALAAGMAPAFMASLGPGGLGGAGVGGSTGASGLEAFEAAQGLGGGGAGGFIGEGAASGIPAWDAAGAAAGAGGKALGLGATALGALAGSQGTGEQTQEKRMDPRLDQYVYGDLLPQAKGLLAQQMPLAQQYGNQMMQVGTGLLGAGIAPNGFERFTRGRY